MKRFTIRADGSAAIGLGHVARMATLAVAARKLEAPPLFAIHASCRAAVDLLRRKQLDVHELQAPPGSVDDAVETARVSERLVVIDGYGFDDAYVAALKARGKDVVVVDDMLRNPPGCHGILNNNVGVTADHYVGALPKLLLLGPRFALVADEFRAARRPARAVAERVLVTFGGADPARVTLRAVAALAHVGHACVVVGGANAPAYADEVRAACAGLDAEVVHGVDDMPARMAWADVALTAGGSTCLELCTVGVPALVVAVADNQLRTGQAYAEVGAMENLGPVESVDWKAAGASLARLVASREQRDAMVAVQHATVDGLGAERVVQALVG